jgi:uncharacterized protein (TIGR01777 family)
MIGSVVTRRLMDGGHEVVRLVHGKPQPGEIHWDPEAGVLNAQALEGSDAAVNLATMPWPFRWTAKAKKAMLANKRAVNELLATRLAACERKPRVLVCASGMGAYRPAGDQVLTEDSPLGEGFLAAADRAGESATTAAERAGIRVVHLRIPMVLGGARLQQVGFQGGDGQQWMSWVGLEEMASIVEFALRTESLSGVVNAVSPNPLRSAEFARVAAEALGIKPGGSMPAFLVRLIMGEMGEEFILASRRITPKRLLESGYRFEYPELADALRHEQSVVEAGKRQVQAVPA